MQQFRYIDLAFYNPVFNVLLLYKIGILEYFTLIYPLVRGSQVCQFYLLRVLPSVNKVDYY